MADEEYLEQLLDEIVEGFELFREQLEGVDELVKEYIFSCVELEYETEIRLGIPVVQFNIYDARIVHDELRVYATPLTTGHRPLEEFTGWYVIEGEDQFELLSIEVYNMIEQNQEMLED